jgi:catechol 2,3-dioxygenase-like lactoylglutathione lyase family enzyme
VSTRQRDEEVDMLGDKNAAATLPVRDMDAARDFYEHTLGLSRVEDGPEDPDPGAVVYRSGGSAVLVYRSTYAGTNQATAATWAVGDDFDSIVEGLRGKGVTFERYDDLPDTTREGDVHLFGDLKAVWFKDPDGNILNLVNQAM